MWSKYRQTYLMEFLLSLHQSWVQGLNLKRQWSRLQHTIRDIVDSDIKLSGTKEGANENRAEEIEGETDGLEIMEEEDIA